jgi:hypothetical protein
MHEFPCVLAGSYTCVFKRKVRAQLRFMVCACATALQPQNGIGDNAATNKYIDTAVSKRDMSGYN